jgi:transcription antitermination factor NusG
MKSEIETGAKMYPWYALRVKSRHEDVVEVHAHARGYESFLPKYSVRRRWSDRIKEAEQPLFPGYVFCRFDPLNRFPVLSIPGVVHAVGFGKELVAVEEAEIEGIRAAVKAGLSREPWPYLQVGSKVCVEHGPLRGVEGILLGFRGERRLVLSVTLLQRAVAVQVDEDWVRTLPEETTALNSSANSGSISWQASV